MKAATTMKALPPTTPTGRRPTNGLPPVTENSSAALTNPLIAPWPMAAARQLPVRTVTYVRKMPTTTQNRHMAAMPPRGQVG